jgi:hypothetical protein
MQQNWQDRTAITRIIARYFIKYAFDDRARVGMALLCHFQWAYSVEKQNYQFTPTIIVKQLMACEMAKLEGIAYE